ncbi:MAG: nucleotidyltransferase domain-containing protein [Planctomycetaceae bacterium]
MAQPVTHRQSRTAFEDRYLAEARKICLDVVSDPRFEIFLFGSRARGHCDHSSDVDIGIAGPAPLGPLLGTLLRHLDDSDVPWRCNVVDFSLVTDGKFRAHAYEGREVWRAAS